MLHEQRQRLGPRPARDLVDAEVLRKQQIADRVDRIGAGIGHHVGERVRLPAQQVRTLEVAEPQIRPARGTRVRGRHLLLETVPSRGVSEPFLECQRSARLDPLR